MTALIPSKAKNHLWVDEWDGTEDKCELKNFGTKLDARNANITQHFQDMQGTFLEIADFRIGGEVAVFQEWGAGGRGSERERDRESKSV